MTGILRANCGLAFAVMVGLWVWSYVGNNTLIGYTRAQAREAEQKAAKQKAEKERRREEKKKQTARRSRK